MSQFDTDSSKHLWLRGALISGIGVLIGIAAFTLFCHSLGLNLRDQGWPKNGVSWDSNRGELLFSFLGFAIATVLFWLGFYQATHDRT